MRRKCRLVVLTVMLFMLVLESLWCCRGASVTHAPDSWSLRGEPFCTPRAYGFLENSSPTASMSHDVRRMYRISVASPAGHQPRSYLTTHSDPPCTPFTPPPPPVCCSDQASPSLCPSVCLADWCPSTCPFQPLTADTGLRPHLRTRGQGPQKTRDQGRFLSKVLEVESEAS